MSLLDGAYARLDRIEAKHAEFRERGDEWVNSPDGKALSQRYIEQRATGLPNKREQIAADVPPILSIIAGEAIYNLRSALDYLAYELVFLSKGAYFEKSQFPIDDDPAKIPRFSAETLARLRPCDRTAIETLQPYNGCEWTSKLRDLSNPDKHRRLTTFGVEMGVRFRLVSATDRHVDRDTVFTIGFDGLGPVAEILDRLTANVADVLDAFKPEFEAQGL